MAPRHAAPLGDGDAQFAESAGDVVDIVLWCEVARERDTEFGSPERVTEGSQDVPGEDAFDRKLPTREPLVRLAAGVEPGEVGRIDTR